MLTREDQQIEYYDELLERLVPKEHAYRRLKSLIDFSQIVSPLLSSYADKGAPSVPVEQGFKALLLQYWEDLSDREAERYLRENIVARWFCGFGLEDVTPDHSYFGRLRKRYGVDRIAQLFQEVNEALERAGYVGNVFHFVDGSALKSRINVWEARDKAQADKENDERDDDGKPKLNNQNVGKYSSDPDARFGCKGKSKFWFGYKRHHRVDMRAGFITAVSVTAANVLDAHAFIAEGLCPQGGMVFLDKGYDYAFVDLHLLQMNCASATIRKKNHAGKNRDLDRWRSSVRMPYESTFSKVSRFTRYRGKQKVLFQAICEALVQNFKRLLVLEAAPLTISA